MNKTVLSLLVAGSIGCSSSTLYLILPVERKQNEVLLFKNDYKLYGEVCTKSVYVGFEKGALQSVLEVEHCYSPKENKGSFNWLRNEDTDGDGLVDKECSIYGSSYVGGTVEDDAGCSLWRWREDRDFVREHESSGYEVCRYDPRKEKDARCYFDLNQQPYFNEVSKVLKKAMNEARKP